MEQLLFRWFICLLLKATFEMISQIVNDRYERETKRTALV